ncbi:hypothetical protein M9Y10_026297 [Tritrichomonas musculus]|uniref:SCP domain-containing protein n=1 Tax=Tritrichomonas musculus TaxID=1915356 RepID=A0ABR2H9J0_9EUKA
MIAFFCLILHQALCADKCTYKSNRVSINTDVSLDDIKDEYRPTFLRLTSPGCPYSLSSDAQWVKASELYPQVNFVTVDCWKNTKICSLYDESFMTPAHALVAANSNQMIEDSKTGNIEDISVSPQTFLNIIQKYANLYPISSPLISLSPMTTDSFYNAIDNPIILLYDSTCSDEVPFLNAWAKIANEEILPDGNYPRIGMLDCSIYPSECLRWSHPYKTQTPRALIYSSKTGNFEVLDTFNKLSAEKIDGLYANTVIKPTQPAPTPVPVIIPKLELPSTEGYTILENSDLQQRPLDTIKKEYKEAFVRPSSACETPDNCKPQTLDSPSQCNQINPSSEDHEKSLKIINFLRGLAGLPKDVSEDTTWSTECYKTAINIHKIGVVPSNHIINEKYATSQYCGEAGNIKVAQDSLLAENSMTVFDASYKFIIDKGSHNDGVVGHRRWLLHPDLKKIGIGFYPYKEENFGTYRMMRPAVTVMKIKENNSPGLFNALPNNLKFISWPPSGPFPLEQLPTNWHITHQDFGSAKLSDLRVFVTRDDGAELKVDQTYLSTGQTYGNALVIKMSDEAMERCQPMRTITVSVFNDANKQVYRFSFQLFDNNEVTEVCLYSSDKSKCPSNIPSDNNFGQGNYQTSIFTDSQNPVIVHVAEPITLDQNGISLTASTRFFISGGTITGKITIGEKTIVDVQDPSKTTFNIAWAVESKNIGKLETAFRASSISIEINNPLNNENIPIYDLTFYTGIQTNCLLTKPLDHGENYDIYYNIAGTDGKYYVMASSSEAFQSYSCTDDSDINNINNIIQLNSIFDLKNQHTNKRVLKVYTSSIDSLSPINISSFLRGQKKDYQFLLVGGSEFYFECDMQIAKYANSITFSQTSKQSSHFNFYAQMPISLVLEGENRGICPMNFITINGGTFPGESSYKILLPYLQGDANAISANDPSSLFDIYKDSNKDDPKVIQAYPGTSTSKTKCIIEIPGTQDEYQININTDQQTKKYILFIIRPKSGTESKQVKLSIFDIGSDNKMPTSKNDSPFYFENFQDLIIDAPTFKKSDNTIESLLPVFRFDNCGKVKFNDANTDQLNEPVEVPKNITLGDFDYGYSISTPSAKITDSLSYDASFITTKTLYVESRLTPTVNGISILETINVNSSTLILSKCTLAEDITVNIKKTESWWPSVSLRETSFKPKEIIIDLGISPSAASILSEGSDDDEYENHILISGISTDSSHKCESIKSLSKVTNNGKFAIECSDDQTEIVAVKNKEKKPILIPEGADGSSDENLPSEKSDTEVIVPETVGPSSSGDGNSPDENPSVKPKDKKKGLSGGAIAGIVIAVLVVVGAGVAVAVYFFVIKKKKAPVAQSQHEYDDQQEEKRKEEEANEDNNNDANNRNEDGL